MWLWLALIVLVLYTAFVCYYYKYKWLRSYKNRVNAANQLLIKKINKTASSFNRVNAANQFLILKINKTASSLKNLTFQVCSYFKSNFPKFLEGTTKLMMTYLIKLRTSFPHLKIWKELFFQKSYQIYEQS